MKNKKFQISSFLFNFFIIFLFVFSYFYPEKSILFSSSEMLAIIIYDLIYIVILLSLRKFCKKKNIFEIIFIVSVFFSLPLFLISYFILESIISFIYFIFRPIVKIYRNKLNDKDIEIEFVKISFSYFSSLLMLILILNIINIFTEVHSNIFIFSWGILYFLFIIMAEFINFENVHKYGVKKY